MNKEIYFCVDEDSFYVRNEGIIRRETYETTELEINAGNSPILTTSLAHLSFDLIDKGYNIYLCYRDKKVKIERGITLASGNRIWEGDLLHYFRNNQFDELLGIQKGE